MKRARALSLLLLLSCAADPNKFTMQYDRVRDTHEIWSAAIDYSHGSFESTAVQFWIAGKGRVVGPNPDVVLHLVGNRSKWRWLGRDHRFAINAAGVIREPDVSLNTRMEDASGHLRCLEWINVPLTRDEVGSLLAGKPVVVAVGNDAFDLANPPTITALRAILTGTGSNVAARMEGRKADVSLRGIGESAALLGLELQVDGVERIDGSTVDALRSATGFLVVTVWVKNTREQPLEQAVRPRVLLFGNDSHAYPPSEGATNALAYTDAESIRLEANPLAPGATRRKRLAFEVPPGDYALRVIVPERAEDANTVQQVQVPDVPGVVFDLSAEAVHRARQSASRPSTR